MAAVAEVMARRGNSLGREETRELGQNLLGSTALKPWSAREAQANPSRDL